MSSHTILVTQDYSVADMGQTMSSEDDFSGRLGQIPSTRPTGISLFRPRGTGIVPQPPEPPVLEVYTPPALPQQTPDRMWESLGFASLDREKLAGNGLFADAAQNPATAAFDILRTRLLQAMAERGWKRIAITSPTHGCGKSLVAANLALSLARLSSCRTVLMDLELRQPDLATLFGQSVGPLRDMLTGAQPLEAHLRRVGRNLALALNGAPVRAAAETLLDPRTEDTLGAIINQLDPDVMVIDMPPALGNDDVISMLPRLDAVLLVADGTRTTAEDIRACERLFEGRVPLMGVVLNRAKDSTARRYRYGKK